MSGVVKGVGNVFVKAGQALSGKKKAAPAEAPMSAQAAAPQPAGAQAAGSAAARVAPPEERAIALRRRRGSRALLSQERVNAESGLGGEMTTLGGM
jgi:hypothetical protein